MEISREQRPNIEIDWSTTLAALKTLLAEGPEAVGDQYDEIKDAVADAEEELQRNGSVSQATARGLDNWHRPFKATLK